MLHKASRLRGITVHATDGPIGSVDDVYFDDERWTVRYLVVSTGSRLDSRRVLIPPMAADRRWDTVDLRVRLTADQVRRSPGALSHRPVSRQEEAELLQHYGYPYYWGGTGLWGAYGFPAALLAAPRPAAVPVPPPPSADDRHLRSVTEVIGYHIHATDGEIGHVDDFLIDEESWRVQYLQIDTSNWIGGRAVVISPDILRGIDWVNRRVSVGISREAVQASPVLDAVDLPPGENAPPFALI
jgi:sporulation protein YlmC with PRC-barrel domain